VTRPVAYDTPVLGSRIGAAAFGVVLLGAGALAGFFTALPVFRSMDPASTDPASMDPASTDPATAILIVVLFGPMSVVLLLAAWSMFVFAATGRRQRLLAKGPLAVLGVVITGGLVTIAAAEATEGEWLGLLTTLSLLAVAVSYAYHYRRVSRAPPR
jgi:hypothetical protein